MNRVEKKPQLELNLASGLPLTVREKDLFALIEKAEKSGFSRFCFLPFRGITSEDALRKIQKEGVLIVHVEDAWNPTQYDNFLLAIIAGILGYAKRFLGDRSEPPILQDALFPGKATSQRLVKELMGAFPEAKFISHSPSFKFDTRRSLLEIHPGLKMEKEEILDFAEKQGIGLVFDPSHLLSKSFSVSYPNEPTKKISPWEEEFSFFAPSGRLEVVDIHPQQKSDLVDLQRNRGLLFELTQAAKRVRSIKYLRVETPLPREDLIAGVRGKERFPILSQIARSLENA